MSFAMVTRLLRAPDEVAEQCRRDDGVREMALVSIMAIALGGAVFGGVIGSFRGGVQILYAGLKVPLAVLLALAVCVPAFHTLAALLGRPWPLRTVLVVTLASSARASLLLLAFAPALWLSYDLGLGYHAAALAAALAYGTAGLAACGILLRGLGRGAGRVATFIAFAVVFFAVAGQTSWILRPYLVRPRTQDIPFVRATEGSFVASLWMSARSSAGIYDDEYMESYDEEPTQSLAPRRAAEPARAALRKPTLAEERSPEEPPLPEEQPLRDGEHNAPEPEQELLPDVDALDNGQAPDLSPLYRGAERRPTIPHHRR